MKIAEETKKKQDKIDKIKKTFWYKNVNSVAIGNKTNLLVPTKYDKQLKWACLEFNSQWTRGTGTLEWPQF